MVTTEQIPRPQHLTVRGLLVRYGNLVAVRDVSFTVECGEIYGILGPSGAGKSSILGALTGVLSSTGQITLGASDLSDLAPRQRRFANVYQDFRLFEWMSAIDNAAFGCRAQGWNPAEAGRQVEDVLTSLGLQEIKSRLVGELSGGERQRVALARALACRPQALLLDEPFSDLDPPLRARLRADLQRWLLRHPIPTILVTHDREEAFEICDRIGFLHDGRLLQEGRPEELHDHPKSPVLAEFMGYANRISGVLESVADDRVAVRTALGLLQARRMVTQGRTGESVSLLCHPHSVIQFESDVTPPNRLTAVCEALHRVESRTVATLALPDGEIWTAHFAGAASIRPGQQVTVSVAAENLYAYGTDTV
ncbi:MAG: ABC transporter ATP-binding protein [Candidatus Zixiibacteriota bacterium]